MTPRVLQGVMVAIVAGAALIGACDPVHQSEIDALGPEDPRVGRGPLHRPGQPCITCHISPGAASPTFTVAGTIFQNPDVLKDGSTELHREPAVDAQVQMTDALGRVYTARTNAAGNFYLTKEQFDPAYPMFVKLCTGDGCDPSAATPTANPMKTHIGREGSCASCHSDPEGRTSVGHVFLVDPASSPAATP